MEPDVSIETGSTIRVAVLPVGGWIPHSRLRSYVAMLGRHSRIDLSSISSFCSEHQKSRFTRQPWDTGSIRFKFMLGGSPPSPWEDSSPVARPSPSSAFATAPLPPDLGLVADQFATACKAYSSSLAKSCFAFCLSDSQLEDGDNKRENITLFTPSDQKTQEFHMVTMMQDLAASLLMEFEKWVLCAESSGAS